MRSVGRNRKYRCHSVTDLKDGQLSLNIHFLPSKVISKGRKLYTPLKNNEISRLTIQTLVSDSLMRQILRQLNKLIDVIAVSNEETTYLKGVLLDENLL